MIGLWQRYTGFLTAVVLVASVPANLAAQEPIYPGDPRWNEDAVNAGDVTVGISAANPYNGNGSLELTLGGGLNNPAGLLDWVFYARTAGAPESSSWGLLSAVESVGMAWYRELLGNENLVSAGDPFHVQSPVLRLLVRDEVAGQQIYSHLVWESYYNTGVAQAFAYNTWLLEDMSSQVFWRHLFSASDQDKYTNLDNPCGFGPWSSAGELTQTTAAGWASCYSPTAVVYGIMVGLGSNWPGQYRGFVDHVQLGFANQNDPAVFDNFEFPDGPTSTVPEPATLVLLGSGLAGLLGAGYLRRRKVSSEQ
ncbi:MAG: PEP-CTERM sorting domain-containing protein [Gemmatimonadales bacterium]